jgi:hypothetical protein
LQISSVDFATDIDWPARTNLDIPIPHSLTLIARPSLNGQLKDVHTFLSCWRSAAGGGPMFRYFGIRQNRIL